MDISLCSLKGGKLLVGRGKKTFLASPHPSLPSWYAPDFFLNEPLPWHTHELYEVVDSVVLGKSYLQTLDPPLSMKAMYEDMSLIKGVVYTSQIIKDFSWESALAHLLEKNTSHFIYGTEGILGATPELLFDLKEGEVSTVALAATSLNTEDLNRPKEAEEHAIVIEGILTALSPYGKVVLEKKEVLSYGNMFHTKTPITLLASPTFQELVKALHPTPALGAWPRDKGSDWLKKWESIKPRKRFGAPFGYVFPERKEARAFVAIRCVQWDKNEASLWAGAGVTKQSLFAEEWEEVLQKLGNIAYLMGI